MNRNKKIIITLFAIVILLTGIWFSLDSHTKNSLYRATLCKLIYGKNICNFYAMMDTQNPSVSDFEKMMNLCQEINDVPKKDSCFEYIAEVFSRIDAENAQQDCNKIKEFNSVHSKESCHSKISKIQEINESKKRVVKTYLEENIWKPNRNGKAFCAYEILGEEDGSNIYQYLWVKCKEYYLENGKLREGGGTSLPVVLVLQKENNIYKVISHKVPRAGSLYREDIERLFPENIRRNKMFSNDVNYLNQRGVILKDKIKKEAEFYFDNPCAVCVNGCDTCPEGCEECLIGIEKN